MLVAKPVFTNAQMHAVLAAESQTSANWLNKSINTNQLGQPRKGGLAKLSASISARLCVRRASSTFVWQRAHANTAQLPPSRLHLSSSEGQARKLSANAAVALWSTSRFSFCRPGRISRFQSPGEHPSAARNCCSASVKTSRRPFSFGWLSFGPKPVGLAPTQYTRL